MECQDIQKLLPVFLDDELGEEQKQDVQVHLTGCDACRTELQELKKSWQMLDSWKDAEPDPGYMERFWADLSGRTPWSVKVREWLSRRVLTPQQITIALGAAVFIVISVISIRNYGQIQETEALLTELPADEAEIVDNLDIVENYDVIAELELLEDMEILENLEGIGS